MLITTTTKKILAKMGWELQQEGEVIFLKKYLKLTHEQREQAHTDLEALVMSFPLCSISQEREFVQELWSLIDAYDYKWHKNTDYIESRELHRLYEIISIDRGIHRENGNKLIHF